MENCKVKAAGSYANVNKVAFAEIQGLNEYTCEQASGTHQGVTNDEIRPCSSNTQQGPNFVPLKRRKSTLSGSRYFTHDLLLPVDDCEIGPATLLQKQKRSRAATVTEFPHSPSRHRDVFRVSSLQTNHSQQYLKKCKKRYETEDEVVYRRHQSTVSDFGDDFDEGTETFSDITNDTSAWDNVDYSTEKAKKGLQIYSTYIKCCGLATVFFYFFLTFGWQVLRVLTDFWLSYIISFVNVDHVSEEDERWYLYSYVLSSLVAMVLSLFSTAFGQYAGCVSRKYLHKKMLNNILKCSVQFFDNTPFGHIINRFSTDIEVVDKKISTSTQRLIQFQLLCASAVIVNCIVTPWFILMIIPIALVYYMVQRFYRSYSRELQRLENGLKSPIINHYSETFGGLETIRALNQQNSFLSALFQKVDVHTNVFLILNSTNRWLGIMLDYLGGVIVFAAMLVSLISVAIKPDLKTSAFFGLAINYTLLIPIYLTWVVKFLIDLEMYMGAVDRIQNYSKLPVENYNVNAAVPNDWPNRGEIRFENVTLRYNHHGRCILQNLNLNVLSGQKVGICGRTGSGKSSLVMSLFKMVPYTEGRIILDDIDINNVPLQHLRSKISIVSQDIILFGGNIRQNLDRRHEFTDEELWNSLKLVQIDEAIANIGGLDAPVQDGGSNLSAGERQLMCLARAILRDTSCLILDEATNSLQPEAEIEFLQLVLKIFRARTVIVITHRVSSILHFDRILVLNNGVMVEDGSPRELLTNSNSKFFNLMKTGQELPNNRAHFVF